MSVGMIIGVVLIIVILALVGVAIAIVWRFGRAIRSLGRQGHEAGDDSLFGPRP